MATGFDDLAGVFCGHGFLWHGQTYCNGQAVISMSLVSADIFMETFLNYRKIWIDGRYGGGKTALAVMMSYWMLEKGFADYLVSNIPVAFASNPWEIFPDDDDRLNTVVLLDEGGLFLRTSSDVDDYLAFLRKSNVYLIVPSVKAPSMDLREFSVWRNFNAKRVGFNVWIYNYILKTGNGKDKDKFYWRDPPEIYGLYDTDARPVDDAGISDWLIYHKERAVQKYKESFKQSIGDYEKRFAEHRATQREANRLSEVEEGRRTAELFAEAAAQISESAETISLSGEKRKRRRRR